MKDALVEGPAIAITDISIPKLLERILSQNPNHVAARDAHTKEDLTYQDLAERSATVARLISSRSGPIALYFEPSVSYLVAVVSVVRLSRTYVAIDPNLPLRQQQLMLEQTGASIILHSRTRCPDYRLQDVEVLAIESLLQDVTQDSSHQCQASEQPIMCYLYTSGSTNTPKGVVIPYSAVLNRLSWQWRTQRFAQEEIVALKTRIGFVDSIAELWAPLLKGIPLIALPRYLLQDGRSTLDILASSKVTRITLVPTLLRSILACLKEDVNQHRLALRTVVSSGEELHLDTCEDFFHYLPSCQLHNYYGSTEVMGDVTAILLRTIQEARNASYEGRITLGTPIDNMKMVLHNTDDFGVGELFCAGPGLAAGYLNTPSNAVFSPGHEFGLKPEELDVGTNDQIWFQTSDLARFYNGNVFFCGRQDDVIKIAGNKVDIGDVARAVNSSAAFRTPPVVIYSHALTKMVALYLNTEHINLKQISASLGKKLPAYALPMLVSVAEFKYRPASGKIDKRTMIAQFEDRLPSNNDTIEYDYSNMQHLDAKDLQVLQNLVGILKDQNITASSLEVLLASNFFTAGGTSLNAVAFVARLKKFGMVISMEDFLAAETLEDVFEQLIEAKSHAASETSSSSDSTPRWTVKPLSHINAATAWEIIAANMVDVQPTLYMWNNAPNKAKARQDCYNEMLLIMKSLEPILLCDPCISFGVFDNDEMIGVCCNFTSDDCPPDIPSNGPITRFLGFLSELEESAVSRLQAEGHKGVHMENLLSVIDRKKLGNPAQHVKAMYFIEEELVRVAQEHKLDFVITTNTSPVTRDIAPLLGYEVEKVTNGFVEWQDEETGKPIVQKRDQDEDFDIQVSYKLIEA